MTETDWNIARWEKTKKHLILVKSRHVEPKWDWLTTKSVMGEVDISLTILFTIWFTIIKKFVYNKADNGGRS